MTTIVKGQPPSTEIRAQLAAEHRPVLVAMSLGKDSIAANLALRQAGIETHLAYMYGIPGRAPLKTLEFVDKTIHDLEAAFGQTIHLYPHPSLFRQLHGLVFQPPERCAVIEAANLVEPTYDELWALIRKDLDLPEDTWCADGVRAADSPQRRAALTTHGPMKKRSLKVSPIFDWQKREVLGIIEEAGIPLPIDYEWFGRSFDGIDWRFLAPLKEHAPRDYERVLDWFPLADLELIQHDLAH